MLKAVFAAIILAICSSPSEAALSIGWAENYGDWSNATESAQIPANWFSHEPDGGVFLKDTSGPTTIAISRAFGLGPLVMPNLWVSDTETTNVELRFPTDYYQPPGEKTLQGKVFIQPFVARGTSIIKAGVFFATLPEARHVKYSIWDAGPNGQRVGDEAVRPPNLSAYTGVWFHGQVPVTPGRLYYLRVEGGRDTLLNIKVADSPDASLNLILDGKSVPGTSLAGFIQSDPPGISTTMACVEGRLHPKPDRDVGEHDVGQTFIATGTSLALVDCRPYVPDVEGDIEIAFVIRSGDTDGMRIAEKTVKGPNGSILQAVWSPGEVPLVPGRLYCVDIRNNLGGPIKVFRTEEIYPGGSMCVDSQSLPNDMDMNIVEYSSDTSPPAPPQIRILSGDSTARIEFRAPQDTDVRKIQVRYYEGSVHENWPVSISHFRLFAEVDVVPGQTGVLHHSQLTNGKSYSYAIYALDWNGNHSTPATGTAFPGKGPVLPPQASLLNPEFKETRANGTIPIGWRLRVESGEPEWRAFTEGDASTVFGWTASSDATACLFQTLTLHPSRLYNVSVRARTTGTATASIHAGDMVGTAALTDRWTTLETTFRAQRTDTDIFLCGTTSGTSDIRFTQVRIRDVTME